MGNKTNWLALLVSVVVSMGIGFLWYGALFQEKWMAANGFTMDGDKMFKNGTEIPMSSTPMIINTVAMAVYALIMNWLIGKTGAKSWMDGAMTGGAVGLMAAIGTHVSNLFALNPSDLSMIDGSYSFVLFTVMGAIIGGWRK